MAKRRHILFFLCFLVFDFSFVLANESVLLDSSALAGKKLFLGMQETLQNEDAVYKLCLGGQELKEFPDEATHLGNLQELNISQNFIETLPESFCMLKNLTELKMSTNSFSMLPECFNTLTNLRHLEIATNSKLNWSEVLPMICRLKSLQYLDLSDNEISYIPECLFDLINLKQLYIGGNKISKETTDHIKNMMSKTIVYTD